MTVYTEKVYKETAVSTVVCKCCSEFFVFSCLICYFILYVWICDSNDHTVTCKNEKNHVLAKAVSHWLCTTEAQVWFQGRQCRICGALIGTGIFFLIMSVFLCQYHVFKLTWFSTVGTVWNMQWNLLKTSPLKKLSHLRYQNHFVPEFSHMINTYIALFRCFLLQNIFHLRGMKILQHEFFTHLTHFHIRILNNFTFIHFVSDI